MVKDAVDKLTAAHRRPECDIGKCAFKEAAVMKNLRAFLISERDAVCTQVFDFIDPAFLQVIRDFWSAHGFHEHILLQDDFRTSLSGLFLTG